MKLPEIKSKGTLADRTYVALKNAIINLELKPGQLITEEEISNILGVSRTPIRTAFSNLQHDGLISIIPGKGTFVSEITEKQVEDLMNVRELLEGLSAQLAARERIEEDLENLRYMMYRQEESVKGKYKNIKFYLDIDSEFHKYIASIGKNEYLEKQLSSTLANTRRFLNALTPDTVLEEVLVEHNKLYEYIKKQDEAKAREHMKKHIDNIKTRMIKLMKTDNTKAL